MGVRNIPLSYTQELLLTEWPCEGQYDFLYCPYSFSRQCICSYAFLNFRNRDLAAEFFDKWQGRRLANHGDEKSLNISLAAIQGLNANLKHLKSNKIFRIKHSVFLPAVFIGTHRAPFKLFMADKGLFDPAKLSPFDLSGHFGKGGSVVSAMKAVAEAQHQISCENREKNVVVEL